VEASLIMSLVALAAVLAQAIKALVNRHHGANDESLRRDLLHDLEQRVTKMEIRLEVHLNGRHERTQ